MQLVQLLHPYFLACVDVAAGVFLYAVFDTVLAGVMLAVGVLVVVAVVHETVRELRTRWVSPDVTTIDPDEEELCRPELRSSASPVHTSSARLIADPSRPSRSSPSADRTGTFARR